MQLTCLSPCSLHNSLPFEGGESKHTNFSISYFWTILRSFCSYFKMCYLYFSASHKHLNDHRYDSPPCTWIVTVFQNINKYINTVWLLSWKTRFCAFTAQFIYASYLVKYIKVPSGLRIWNAERLQSSQWVSQFGWRAACLLQGQAHYLSHTLPSLSLGAGLLRGLPEPGVPALSNCLLLCANELAKSSMSKWMLEWKSGNHIYKSKEGEAEDQFI